MNRVNRRKLTKQRRESITKKAATIALVSLLVCSQLGSVVCAAPTFEPSIASLAEKGLAELAKPTWGSATTIPIASRAGYYIDQLGEGTDGIGTQNLEEKRKTLTILSYPEVDKSAPEVYKRICEKVGLNSEAPQVTNIQMFIKKCGWTVTKYNVVLYGIGAGRWSPTNIIDYNNMLIEEVGSPITIGDGSGENANATLSAEVPLKNIESTLAGLDTGAAVKDKQFLTICDRLQAHYYMMQTDLESELAAAAMELSTTDAGFGTNLYVLPPTFSNAQIANPQEYVYFCNALQELPDMGAYLFDVGLHEINSANYTKAEIVKYGTYLLKMKSAITFLESMSVGDCDSNIRELIDWWYSSNPKYDMSLEELSQKVRDFDIGDIDSAAEFESADDHPFKNYFDIESEQLSTYAKMGIGVSATFIPMQTNVYDPYTYSMITNENFFEKFHYIWGYNRKALYMGTSVTSVVDYYTNTQVSSLKVCTLKDLLDADKDILLFADTKTYNREQVLQYFDEIRNQLLYQTSHVYRYVVDGDTIGKTGTEKETPTTTTTEEKEKTEQDSEEQEQTAAEALSEAMVDASIADNMLVYSAPETATRAGSDFCDSSWDEFDGNVTSYAEAVGDFCDEGTGEIYDRFFASRAIIDKYFNTIEYSAGKQMAVISALVRDKKTLSYLKEDNMAPVFASSKDLVHVSKATTYDKSSYFNYLLLQNIAENTVVDYKTSLDYNQPVFLDIYGNIVTYSGTVVVPAAANQTLYKKPYLYTAAFIQTYGQEMLADSDVEFMDTYDNSDIDKKSELFELDEEEKYWRFKTVTIDDVIDINHLSFANDTTKQRLYNLQRLSMEEDKWFSQRYITNVMVPVMLSAPLEAINLASEELSFASEVDSAGVEKAVKLQLLKDALGKGSENTILCLPNLAFMKGIEYVIYFTYRIAIFVFLLMLLVMIYVNVVEYSFSVKAFLKLVCSVGLVIGIIITVPVVFQYTYYGINKWLLQSEAEYVSMLNYEKREAGIEVSMTETDEPSLSSSLLLKVEDIDIQWGSMFENIVLSSLDTTMDDIYNQAANNSLLAAEECFERYTDALYMNVEKLYESSTIVYDITGHSLYQYSKEDLPASYCTPYYAFLDALIARSNLYNVQQDVYSYTTKRYRGGQLKTVGLVNDYFLSDEFIDDEKTFDILGLSSIYGGQSDTYTSVAFSAEAIDSMRKSYWCQADRLTDAELVERIKRMDKRAREFVSDNKDILGSVSDDTFLKAMALDLAIYHNKIFEIDSMDAIEVYKLSADDLGMIMTANRSTVMYNSPYSYSRFIYELGNQPAVYVAAFREVLVFVEGWVKAISTLAVIIAMYVSIFIYRFILNRKNDNVKGLMKLLALMIVSNLIHACILKLGVLAPIVISSPTLLLLGQCIASIGTITWYGYLAYLAVFHWKDMGNYNIDNLIVDSLHVVNRNMADKYSNWSGLSSGTVSPSIQPHRVQGSNSTLDGEDLLNRLREDDHARGIGREHDRDWHSNSW